MLASALMLALAISVRADCDACVNGVCHHRETLLKGFRVSDQLAVDRTHNVLYTQLNDNQNIALFLNNPEVRLLHTMKTSGMAVDQRTQTLYLGTKEIKQTFYKYDFVRNTTEAVPIELDDMKPDLMFYGDNKLHFIGKNLKGVNFVNGTGEIWHKKRLKNYTISDFVLDMNRTIFFVSNNTVYVYNNDESNWQSAPKILVDKNHVLSADAHGYVYLGDVTQKVIHKYTGTGKLEIYASYKSGAIVQFVFDRSNDMVFRDADGDVARWVPDVFTYNCRVEPPHQGYLIRELPEEPCV